MSTSLFDLPVDHAFAPGAKPTGIGLIVERVIEFVNQPMILFVLGIAFLAILFIVVRDSFAAERRKRVKASQRIDKQRQTAASLAEMRRKRQEMAVRGASADLV